MTTITNFPTLYIEDNGFMGPGRGTDWSHPSEVLAEDGHVTNNNMFSPTTFHYGFYWGGAFRGEQNGAFPTSTLEWSNPLPTPSLPTVSQINADDFGIVIYYHGFITWGPDIYTYHCNFSIPTGSTITAVNGYVKHSEHGRIDVDATKITVDYIEPLLGSPSSNAYSGGPMMF